jgi:hypothetical protein
MLKVKAIISVIIALFFISAISFAKTPMTTADIKAFNDAKTLCGCKPSKIKLNFRRALAKARLDAGLTVTPWQEHLAKELSNTAVSQGIVEPEPIVVEVPKIHMATKPEVKPLNKVGPMNIVTMCAMLALLIGVGIKAFKPKRKQKPKKEKFIVLTSKPEINYAVNATREEPSDPKPPMLSPVACDLKLYGTNDYFEKGEKLNDADEYFNRFIRLQT